MRSRSGASPVETVTLLVALLVGIVAGSLYLGTDLTQLVAPTTTAADAALEDLPADDASADSPTPLQPPAPPHQAEASPPAVPTALQSELAELRAEIDRLRAATAETAPGRPAAAPNSAPAAPGLSEHELQGRRTLDYWNQMNQVMAHEEAMRRVPQGGLTAANAADFIRRRGEAGIYAVNELARIDPRGVDPAVVAHCRAIAQWYQRGSSLNSQADYLLNQGTVQQRRGTAGKAWSGAEKQHQGSVEQLNQQSRQLRDQMQQKYGLDFPPLR